jgi:hypothetical protein
MYRHEVSDSYSQARTSAPVTCAACGCRLQASTGARDGEYTHFGPFNGRDARGCRVDCVSLVHDMDGRPVLAAIS